jgi:predicted aldo/keto reductase-like oxidoreductase
VDTILGPGGALEAVLEAKKEGLVKYIGITGHRPEVYVKALERFEFDTVLFPLSRVHAAHLNEHNNFLPLLELAKQKDVGTIAIKVVSKQSWGNREHAYGTWYEPFDRQADIDKSLWYALSQGVTTLPMPSDLTLWPKVISAAERYKPMTAEEQTAVVSEVRGYQPISVPG